MGGKGYNKKKPYGLLVINTICKRNCAIIETIYYRSVYVFCEFILN